MRAHFLNRRLIAIAGAVLTLVSTLALAEDALPGGGSEGSANSVAVEALSRLEGVDLNTNPALKKAVLRILDTTRGTPQFVQIVQKFDLKDQDQGLLDVAAKMPNDDAGVEAARLILAHNDWDVCKRALAGTNLVSVAHVVEAIGNAREKSSVPFLSSVLNGGSQDSAVRKQAVKALAQTPEGAEELLRMARADALGQDVRFVASSELNGARWPAVKAAAAKLLPLPQGNNQQSLPPVSELLKMKGDAANGEKVLAREQTACLNCHRIKGTGAQIGPDLSEIGTKLGEDAIYEAILDPSAGIAFGYEAYQIELKSGDEAYGLIVSETADEIAVKDLKGIVTHYKKSDITRKDQLKTSIMPTGLQQTMTTQEFVDLVKYLSTLKKAGS